MDTDLFQVLTLFLLLGLLLTLFGVLQSLGAIRRLLEREGQPATSSETAAAATSSPAAATSTAEEDSPLTWARPTETSTGETGRSGWPAPQEATATPEPAVVAEPEPQETSAPSDEGARVLYGDTGLTAATPSEAALSPSGSAGTETSQPAAAQTPEPQPQAQAASEDPQEQPFERDGRWWFRRGDELLVYEEQSGQWVAAGEPSTSGSVAAAAPGEAAPSAGIAAGAAEGQVTTPHEAVGSFWKCPSCGAVNGSTATSCRMCFTARP
jgi:hypothetical protein